MHEDLERVERYLEGEVEVLGNLRAELEPILKRILQAKCVRLDLGLQAHDEIWARCVVDPQKRLPPNGTASLLEKYNGKSSLKSWLTTVILNLYRDLLRREAIYADPPVPSDMTHAEVLESYSVDPDTRYCREEAISELLNAAVQAAWAQCPPDGLLMCRLHLVHQIEQFRLAPIWGCDPATINRRLNATLLELKSLTLEELKRLEPGLELEWADVQQLLQEGELSFI